MAADTLNPGVGLTFLSCARTAKTWSLEAVYDYFWRNGSYAANRFMVRFTARFQQLLENLSPEAI